MDQTNEFTHVLEAVNAGDDAARERLLSLVYQELHDLASLHMQSERANHTLQSTALVHEAYLRLTGDVDVTWQNRSHFFGAAAEAMRRILVDHARSRAAAKRGGGRIRQPLESAILWNEEQGDDVIAIDGALSALEDFDPAMAEVVKLRFFGGLSIEQIAAALDISTPTVKRRWRFARAWLYRELES